MPRPPDTMISASVWSGSSVWATSMLFTTALILEVSKLTATFSTAPAPAVSFTAKELGLTAKDLRICQRFDPHTPCRHT